MNVTYLVVTSRGYWGRADDPVKAAQNANVGKTYVSGSVFAMTLAVATGHGMRMFTIVWRKLLKTTKNLSTVLFITRSRRASKLQVISA